jgi:hypothetical protein
MIVVLGEKTSAENNIQTHTPIKLSPKWLAGMTDFNDGLFHMWASGKTGDQGLKYKDIKEQS